MSAYQGSDWFKSGAHVRVNPTESKKQLVHHASQQLADYSKKLQLAYDGGLALFKNNFIGTDGQIQEAQQTLAAILAVSNNLQDLHQRLASSLMASASDSAVDYIVDGNEQHTDELLALLKAKEERLQIEVNKCAELRAENVLLTKQLQGLSKPSSRQHSGLLQDGMQKGSILAGRNASSGSATMDRGLSQSSDPPLVLNGVLSLANAGTWLQMLRSKLASNSPDRRRSDFADAPDTTDSTMSGSGLPAQQEEEEDTFGYAAPMRRSRSDALHDRKYSLTACRRGSELARSSSAGHKQSSELCEDALSAVRARDRRRRTNVMMEDVSDSDQGSTLHFLTPELAARSALFGG